MDRLFFALALALTAKWISLLTGRNRRQLQKVPEGMSILCQPPGKRYILYALGVVVMAVVLFFGVLYLLDGAPESARPMWGLCIAVAVLTLGVCILGGNIQAKDCVYYDEEKFQVNRPFREPQVYPWSEVDTIRGSFDREITLYQRDGTKILAAGVGMVHYEGFCAVLKQKCPGSTMEYYRTQHSEHPQKCVLRYGPEYYLLAVMGILMLLVYLAMLASAGGAEFLQRLPQSEPSEWFSLWFGPISGIAGIIALVVFCNTKVWYSPAGLVLKFPLRKKQEVSWREIQKIELVMTRKQGKQTWKWLRLFTKEKVYRIDLAFLTAGKDGFWTELLKNIKKYEIPCESARK